MNVSSYYVNNIGYKAVVILIVNSTVVKFVASVHHKPSRSMHN